MTAGAYSLLAVVLYHTGDFNQVLQPFLFLVFLVSLRQMNYPLLSDFIEPFLGMDVAITCVLMLLEDLL